jgi:hypothetical protein
VRRCVADQGHDPPDVAGRCPAQLVDGDVKRFVDAFRPVAAAARFQLEQVGVEILDVGGEIEGPRDIVIANVAIGDEAHADVGVGIAVDDRGRDRPDLALGAFDQAAHRARGVEHERDLDGRLGDGCGNGGRQWQGGERERECADGDGWLHGSPPVVRPSEPRFPSLRVPVRSKTGRGADKFTADPVRARRV